MKAKYLYPLNESGWIKPQEELVNIMVIHFVLNAVGDRLYPAAKGNEGKSFLLEQALRRNADSMESVARSLSDVEWRRAAAIADPRNKEWSSEVYYILERMDKLK